MITLSTLETATTQSVFDQGVNLLLTQNKKSTSDSIPGSVYHGKNGLRCPAGSFISVSEYTGYIEQHTWEELIEDEKVPDHHSDIIIALQLIHDQEPVAEWKDSLALLAANRELEFNPPI